MLLLVLVAAATLFISSAVMADAPANDDFDAATPIILQDGQFADEVDMTDATRAVDDPDSGACAFDTTMNTVWYSVQFPAGQLLTISTDGSDYPVGIMVFTGTRGSLNLEKCLVPWDDNYLTTAAGETYHLMVQFAGNYYGYGSDLTGVIRLSVGLIEPPANDNMADAAIVDPLPFTYAMDMRAATREAGEPVGSCIYYDEGVTRPTVWFAFTPADSGYYTIDLGDAYGWWITTYRMSALGSLVEYRCDDLWSGAVSLPDLQAGETYHIQVSNREWAGTQATFHLDVPPDPVPEFGWDPYEPSIFRDAYFYSYSYDPANVGIARLRWDFGDGTVVEEDEAYYLQHRYSSDGDYLVSLEVTTHDGRTASVSNTVTVRTHDVGISRFRVPRTAMVGKTQKINIGLSNKRYAEWVEVELYKSSTWGFERVATQRVWLAPADSKRPTTSFVTFRYTVTPEDGMAGKITFRAYVSIQGYSDAFPTDNEAISPPVRVKK